MELGGNQFPDYSIYQNEGEKDFIVKETRKGLWVLLVLFTVVAMLFVSCKSEPVEEEVGETTIIKGVTETLITEREKTEDTSRTEKPQYGGIGVGILAADQNAFDEAFGSHPYVYSLHLTNEEMMEGDWTKGPAGTGEADFTMGGVNAMSLKTGCLADNYEIPEKGTMIFHIREGVHWHNKAPCNGRELTVDDVVYTFKRMCTEPGAYIRMTYPTLSKTIEITSNEATRTVTLKCPVSEWANLYTLFPDFCTIMPKDALEQFGNMNDWRNSIGTGPFMLTDYVSGGSMTFVRNPNYWKTNPSGPGKGDQLPYLDGVKWLVITDTSTAMAAFRVGKVDGISSEYDDVKEFVENPEIKHMVYTVDYSMVISMRTDKADLPFSKKEVRQALTMAIDFEKIKNDFYSGKAVIFNWPICYTKEYAAAYVAFENLPPNCQELYSHNVTRAKELLIQAGYPTGFNVSILTYNTPTYIDYLSLIKDMWGDVGVTVTLDTKDLATYSARVRAKNYDSMFYYNSSGNWAKMQNFAGSSQYNMSYVNDSVCNEALARSMDLIGVDEIALMKNFADIVPYVVEQCYQISKPSPYTYTCWWPWVKNWNGELNVGYYNGTSYLKYRWCDVALKQQMLNK
jgi:peptide/nickel transport system substrate-binding protein